MKDICSFMRLIVENIVAGTKLRYIEKSEEKLEKLELKLKKEKNRHKELLLDCRTWLENVKTKRR